MKKEKQQQEITAIVAQKRPGRFNVFLNGRYAFPVAESVLIKYRLYKGMEVDKELLEQISNDDQVAQAYSKMLDYLSHQLRTEHEVKQKLTELAAPPEIVPVVMAKLRENQLLDDQEYAAAFVRTEMNTTLKGPGVIRQKLRQKRVGELLIDRALEQFTIEQQQANATKLVKKLAKRYANQPVRRQEEKIRQGVITQGYSGDVYQLVKETGFPTPDQEGQEELLTREAQKVWRRYQRYQGYERELKVKQALYRKGFELDEIDHWLADQENLNNWWKGFQTKNPFLHPDLLVW